jgi:hypothetical protein
MVLDQALAVAAAKIGITGVRSILATNTTASVLETTIKQMDGKELTDIMKEKSLTMTKKRIGIPTTQINIKFGK